MQFKCMFKLNINISLKNWLKTENKFKYYDY